MALIKYNRKGGGPIWLNITPENLLGYEPCADGNGWMVLMFAHTIMMFEIDENPLELHHLVEQVVDNA